MLQGRLNDAAIALHNVLKAASIEHGIFGGYAVAALGGPRESKDVDCLASATKDEIVKLLNGKHGFTFIPQTRPDYAAFFWTANFERKNNVLVELFVDHYQGSELQMAGVNSFVQPIQGDALGNGVAVFLDPVYIFKGKLRASATRELPHDAADLRWLEGRYRNELQAKKGEFNREFVGLALKRSPQLEHPFARIGIDIANAKARVATVDMDQLPEPKPGDVQRGLLALP